ncbi:hypothetical protein CR513_53020, partial [Mucuna pruriens]
MFFRSFKVEVELQLGKKLKLSNLIMVVNIMVDMIDQKNNSFFFVSHFRESSKVVNKIPYELWMKKSQALNTYTFGASPYRPHERKLDSGIISCCFTSYVECSQGYKVYDPTSRSFFRNGKCKNVFEEESVNNIGQVLISITTQETTLAI